MNLITVPPAAEFQNEKHWQLPPGVACCSHCIERSIKRCILFRLDSIEKLREHADEFPRSTIGAIVLGGDIDALWYAAARRSNARYVAINEAREQRQREAADRKAAKRAYS